MAEAVALGHRFGDETECAGRKLDPFLFAEEPARIGERGDHQAVPVGEHLVVEAGANALRADLKKLLAQRREPLLVLYAAR